MAEWGLDVHLYDLHEVIKKAHTRLHGSFWVTYSGWEQVNYYEPLSFQMDQDLPL